MLHLYRLKPIFTMISLPFVLLACSKATMSTSQFDEPFLSERLHFGQSVESPNAMNLRSVKINILTTDQLQVLATCQGTVYEQGIILTAGHCKEDLNLKNIELAFSNPNDLTQPILIRGQVTDFLVHPNDALHRKEVELSNDNSKSPNSFDIGVIRYNSKSTQHLTHLNKPLVIPNKITNFNTKKTGSLISMYSSFHALEFGNDFNKYILKSASVKAESGNHYTHSVFFQDSTELIDMRVRGTKLRFCEGDSGAGLWLTENEQDFAPTLMGIAVESDAPGCSSMLLFVALERENIQSWLRDIQVIK